MPLPIRPETQKPGAYNSADNKYMYEGDAQLEAITGIAFKKPSVISA